MCFAVGTALFSPAVGTALFSPAVGTALFSPAVGTALFSPAVHPSRCSCPRSSITLFLGFGHHQGNSSAGLTSTTVLFLRALRVKGSPSSSIALVSRPRRSLALVASLSTNTTMFSRVLLRPLGRAPTEALQVAVVTALAMCLMVSGHFSAQTRSF